MQALPTGIAVLVVASLATLCPTEWIYAPALLAIVVAGGFLGGTIFSMQSEGVYELRIRRGGPRSGQATTTFGGVWDYGFIGVAAGMIGLLITARLIGITEQTIADALVSGGGIAGAARRLATSVGIFSVTLISGFLGLNLIRMVSDKVMEEIRKKVDEQFKEQLTPDRLADRASKLLENHAYETALKAYRDLGTHEQTLRSTIGQALALRHLARVGEAIACLDAGIKEYGKLDSEPYRRAIAYWNRACYKSLNSGNNFTDETVTSIIADLRAALDNEAGFKNSLKPANFDPDLIPVRAVPRFAAWLAETVGG